MTKQISFSLFFHKFVVIQQCFPTFSSHDYFCKRLF